MLERLATLEDRYQQLNELLSDPEVISNPNKLREYSKEQADLEETVTTYRSYRSTIEELNDAKEMLEEDADDDEMVEMIKAEIEELTERRDQLEEKLKVLLLPKDPNDDKNVVMEIRAAAGGDEAALFAGDLYRMYTRYAEANGWKTEVIEAHASEIGGYKEIVFMINGNGAYSKLKFENGAHRVQRVPETEASGRVHTSTATVAVLPEAEEVDVEIRNEDIKIDTYRASGAGGQHVNKTESAIRITHLKTGIVVQCQSERSQIANKEAAMAMLKAKLIELKERAHKEKIEDLTGELKDMGWGSQIRSYVFHPYNLVKDHRTNEETANLNAVMNGEIDNFIIAYLKNN